ncbi:hypothetical protein KZX45_12730 [Georgenia sp. EYE_87]|uniref:hypothetical protein n=1 Tax=Georgenia sp. EYE_87 TaxID=2853448 RepID=UPI00200369C1|nr:hypothetical protein [Georgenia sp. EYE_87]MCK6211409.1 hypothetical protein [Georgenia sp. EYE_87]
MTVVRTAHPRTPLSGATRPGVRTARRSWRATVTDRHSVLHLLQMVIAMVAGMVVLMPVAMLLDDGAGVEVRALLMATTMTVGMTAWMAFRRHSWAAIAEMGLAMYLSFAVLFPVHWLGVLPEAALITLGHVLMLPAMAVAMLRRREEYLGGH